MIYLIGGSHRCGKTILSKRIGKTKKISVISTDALRPMVMQMVPKSELKKKFPQTNMPTPKNKFRFDVYSPQELLKGQITEAKSMWPSIKAFITSLIYRDQDYVIEGTHLFPGLINQFKNTENWKHIKVVFLIKMDLNKIQSGFSKNKDVFDWMYPVIKDDDERLTKAAKGVREKGKYIKREASKFNLKLYNTENDFNNIIKQAQRYLIKR